MSVNPFKITGWSQALNQISATKKEILGSLRITNDGRKYRYAKAGELLAQGKICQTPAAIANHIAQVQTAYGAAQGASTISVIVGATAAAADYYADGYFCVYDGAAGTVGYTTGVISSAYSAGSAPIVCQLQEPLAVAILATDTVSLVKNPWDGVMQNASVAFGPAGVPNVAVTNAYFFWCQTGGVCAVLGDATPTALGAPLQVSATEGAVGKHTETNATDVTSSIVGYTQYVIPVSTKYHPIYLKIE